MIVTTVKLQRNCIDSLRFFNEKCRKIKLIRIQAKELADKAMAHFMNIIKKLMTKQLHNSFYRLSHHILCNRFKHYFCFEYFFV